MNRLPSYGYLLILASLLCFGLLLGFRRKETAKRAWPSVPGRVTIDSKIIRTEKAYLETPTAGRTMRDDTYYRFVKVWALTVEYSYQIAGQDYEGTQATATNHVDAISDYPDGPSKQMLDWQAQLSKGTAVSVHYDPSTPTESYIIYTENPIQTVMIIGCVLMALGIALVAIPRLLR